MATIAFLGLGNMGYPMAGHLANSGHQLRVFNRTHNKAQRWVEEFPGTACTTPATTTHNADAVILCVGRDADVRELLNDQLLAQLQPGTLLIDHTTTSARLAEELAARCAEQGLRFADVPVSGGQQGAINGQLSLMAGCAAADYDDIVRITAPYTRLIERLGNPGCGQKAKMVNQICVAGLIQALAEGLQFARNAGLDAEQVMKVIGQGAASSWQLQNRHQTMLNGEFDHGFAVDWMRKDLQICLQEALHNGSSLPVTALVDQFYGELQQQGAGKLDTSALLLRLPKSSR
ncbi:NAD-binding protein [Oceanospirillaceae bacterium ASx5O]|nr:NAD-binding protein [Oceanospirillaceae bacterium ASx5O]